MCGIVYAKSKNKTKHRAVAMVLERFNYQRNRGTQGFGFVAVKDGKVIGYHRSQDEAGFRTQIERYKDTADEVLMHHRLPTSAKNMEITAHPFLVSNPLLQYDYYLVHNGHISNHHELKLLQEELGFEYTSEVESVTITRPKNRKGKKHKSELQTTRVEHNDSESLAIDFALFNEGVIPDMRVKGNVAFMCYQVDRQTGDVVKLHYGRNTNPLRKLDTTEEITISSENVNYSALDTPTYKHTVVDYLTGAKTESDMVIGERFSYPSSSYNTGSSYSGGYSSAVGYRRSSADVHSSSDLSDDIDYGHQLRLPMPSNKNVMSMCEHGSVLNSTSECPRCVSRRSVERMMESARKSDEASGEPIVMCRKTGDNVNECMCKSHKKKSRALKRKLRKQEKKNKALAKPSPYQSELSESPNAPSCGVCGHTVHGTLFENKYQGVMGHSYCADVAPEKEPEDEEIGVPSITRDHIENRIAVVESEMDSLSEKIGIISDNMYEYENDQSKVEDWLKLYDEQKELTAEYDTKKRLLERMEKWLNASPF